jgi:KEOPS complex subunit Pcc1
MKTKATVNLILPSKQQAQIIIDALKPEISHPPSRRSKAIMRIEDRVLILEIETEDTTALRASLNSYLRWIKSVCDVLKNLKAYKCLQ